MSKSRGTQRERAVRDLLREDGWVVYRPGASLGCADLVALRSGEILLVQVKSCAANPYAHFLPADRKALLLEAERAGARATLAWWPPRGRLVFIESDAWPKGRSTRLLQAV